VASGVLKTWTETFEKETSAKIVYKATGSGDGIKQMTARSADFALTDDPVDSLYLASNKLAQFPIFIGAIVPVINVPGVDVGQLRLTGRVLAEIFAGRIALWSDEQIQSLNPSLRLPKLAIVRVVRSDESGSTAVFSEYLSKVSAAWAGGPGSGLAIKWPAEVVAVRGGSAVLEKVGATPGAIGYGAFDAVNRAGMPMAQLQNRSGAWIAPSAASLAAAASASDIASSHVDRPHLIDQRGAEVWPISLAVFALVDAKSNDSARMVDVLRFFHWAALNGDGAVSKVGLVPLPLAVRGRVLSGMVQMRTADGRRIDFLSAGR
jgi:phosphate transport system substrate-binding protein